MARSNTKSYILELELCFDHANPASVLLHASNSATSIYNACLGECLKRYHKLCHDREYQQLQEDYKNAINNNKPLKQFYERYRDMFQKYGYSEYSLQEYASVIRKGHYPNFGAAETQALATRAFRSADKIRVGKAERVRFHRMKDGTSFEGKSHTSKLHYDPKDGCVHYGKHIFRLKIKPNDEYAQPCLMDNVKYVRIVRRDIRGKTRWYCQLVLKGIPPAKNTIYGEGSGGIDEGVSTIAYVTDTTARLEELAPECAEDEKKIRRLQRAMDRSRRATNPHNFNEDGTIQKGIKLRWNNSERYRHLQKKLKEIRRHTAVMREISHHKLAKQILKEASDLKVERMSIQGLARRSKKTTVNQKNGRIHRKKRYGNTIRQRAPARLIAILDEKLSYIGKSVTRIDTHHVKASQYNPLDGSFKKKELRDRMIELDEGVIVQRDLLSAYCILHTSDTNDSIDAKGALKNFDTFKQHNDAEIRRLRNERKLTWYTA